MERAPERDTDQTRADQASVHRARVDRARFNMVVSFPRSGTDFFCTGLQQMRGIRYFREYFNPICNQGRAAVLETCFGDERVANFYNILNETDAARVADVLDRSWRIDPYDTTKENFSALRIEHLVAHFNMICLIRNMAHTFPTSSPDYVVPIYSSFMLAGPYRQCFLARELNELRAFLAFIPAANAHDAGILAYIVQHYVLLAACRRFAIPILRYEELMTLAQDALARRLDCARGFGVDPVALAGALCRDRMPGGEATLLERRRRAAPLLDARWLTRVLHFIDDLSPELRPDLDEYLMPVG